MVFNAPTLASELTGLFGMKLEAGKSIAGGFVYKLTFFLVPDRFFDTDDLL